MTTYVITIPGTFLEELTGDARTTLLERLRPSDPQQTELGEAEDLDVLTVNDNGTFSIRLEVEAEDTRSAEADAAAVAGAALRDAGFTGDTAPLGHPAVTGIDTHG
ncbi:hypothetical protein [Streptacidiphilus sp. ASG 303]|uniref:hypothetical protein n=1 Tax=Streptomycetaceae TaxID=2062 RepID=UPI001E49FD77|nr:hypothetical protein [Streptacidiphilus sp. ASG 303]MCD0483678.1 hypothetical protein [Streptacidiphilus sp. ASG 303]